MSIQQHGTQSKLKKKNNFYCIQTTKRLQHYIRPWLNRAAGKCISHFLFWQLSFTITISIVRQTFSVMFALFKVAAQAHLLSRTIPIFCKTCGYIYMYIYAYVYSIRVVLLKRPGETSQTLVASLERLPSRRFMSD